MSLFDPCDTRVLGQACVASGLGSKHVRRKGQITLFGVILTDKPGPACRVCFRGVRSVCGVRQMGGLNVRGRPDDDEEPLTVSGRLDF